MINDEISIIANVKGYPLSYAKNENFGFVNKKLNKNTLMNDDVAQHNLLFVTIDVIKTPKIYTVIIFANGIYCGCSFDGSLYCISL